MNLLFTGHDFKFLTPVIEYFEKKAGVSVRIEKQRGHDMEDIAEAEENCRWADVIFCEWAFDNLRWYSQNKRPGQILIARLHSQELRVKPKYMKVTNWANVDHMILICPSNEKLLLEKFPETAGKIELIYNPIPAVEASGIPKMEGSDFNLGFVGIVPQLKRLDLCFSVFEKLKARDSRWNLYIKGKKPQDFPWMADRPEEMKFYNALFKRIDESPYRNSVIFDKHGSDMLEWYSKIGFIMSTSDFEGSHQAVAEGMASGCIPVIRNWLGADELYPKKFTCSYDATPEELASAVNAWKKDGAFYEQAVEECRAFAVKNFDNAKICKEIEGLMKKHPSYPAEDVVLAEPVVNAMRKESGKGAPPQIMVLAFMSSNAIDGYRIRVEQMLKRLSALGAKMRLLCLHLPLDDDRKEALKKANDAIGVPYDLVECPAFFSLAFSEDAVQNELAQIEEIIAANGIRFVQAEALYCSRFLCFLKKRNPELYTVLDCHGASPAEEEMGGASPQRVKHSSTWEDLVFHQVDGIIFVADAMRKYYDDLYKVDTYRSVIVPCCVEVENTAKAEVVRRSDIPQDANVIGYLGTLAVWQCAKEMFELFRVLNKIGKNIFFYMILPVRDHEQCRKYFKEAGISKRNYKVEEIPHDQVPGALSRLDAGLLLRRDSVVNRVSSPTKFGEYLESGVPVILTDCIGDYSSLVPEYSLGEVLPAPEDGWTLSKPQADRIIALMKRRHNDPGKFTEMSRKVVRDLLAWDINIQQLYKFYNELGGGK